MCVFGGGDKPDDPKMPPIYAMMRSPRPNLVRGPGQLLKARLKNGPATLLTGPNGVGAADTSGKNVLLGS